MVRSAIQLYTLRRVEKPLVDLLTTIGEAGFEGVEYANRIGSSDIESVNAALEKAGLESVAAHVDIEEIEDDPVNVVEYYHSIGCNRLVVPYLDGSHFESEDAIETTANRLTTLAETVSDHGASLHYHNHDHEFVDVNGQTGFERLADVTGDALSFEIDLGWAAAAGVDPVSLLDRLGERVSLVHASDVDETGSPTELGTGILDISACVAAVRDHGIEWAIYEHDEPTDPMASVGRGAEILPRF